MNIIKPPLEYYLPFIGTPFAFVRYGDGEFQSIMGNTTGQNCDGHKYFASLGDDLRQSLVLTDDNYVRAIGHMALKDPGQSIISQYMIDNSHTY